MPTSATSAQKTDAVLRDVVRLFTQAQRTMTACCSEATAKGVFQGALRDAMSVYPDLAIRCGLTRPLES